MIPAVAAALNAPFLATNTAVLPNGVAVVAHAMPEARQVAVLLHLPCGATADPPDRLGLAHLLEHVAFVGSLGAPGASGDRWVELAGGSSGAYTTHDAMRFASTADPPALELLAFLESERLAWLAPTTRAVEGQRAVVRREIELAGDDGIYRGALGRLVWGAEHPYARPVVGEAEGIEAATRREVLALADGCFAPDRARVVVVGPEPAERLLRVASERFSEVAARAPPAPSPGEAAVPAGAIPAGSASASVAHATAPAVPSPALPSPPDPAGSDARADPDAGSGGRPGTFWLPLDVYPDRLAVAWPLAGQRDLALDAAAHALRGRLADMDPEVSNWVGARGGRFVVELEASRPAAALGRIIATLSALAREGPGVAELARWSAGARTRELLALQRPTDRADALLACWTEQGDPDCLPTTWAARSRVRSEDVARAVRAALPASSRVVLVSGPTPRLLGASRVPP